MSVMDILTQKSNRKTWLCLFLDNVPLLCFWMKRFYAIVLSSNLDLAIYMKATLQLKSKTVFCVLILIGCLQSPFSLKICPLSINPSSESYNRSKHEKGLGRDKKGGTVDSFLIFKPSIRKATESLIGQFVGDDRSLTR